MPAVASNEGQPDHEADGQQRGDEMDDGAAEGPHDLERGDMPSRSAASTPLDEDRRAGRGNDIQVGDGVFGRWDGDDRRHPQDRPVQVRHGCSKRPGAEAPGRRQAFPRRR